MLLLVFTLITSVLLCSIFRNQDDMLVVTITWAIVTYFLTAIYVSLLDKTIVEEQKSKKIKVSDLGGLPYLLDMFEYNTPLAICTFFYTLISVAAAFLTLLVIQGKIVYLVLFNIIAVILILDILSFILSVKNVTQKRNSLSILVYYQTWFLNRLSALLLKTVLWLVLAPFLFIKFLIVLFFL